MRTLLWRAALLSFLLSPGCDGLPPPTFETTLSLRNGGDVETTSFASGEAIKLVMKLRNLTDQPQTLTFPYPHTFDFAAYRQGQVQGRPQWYWSEDTWWFTPETTQVTLAPAETKEFAVMWTPARWIAPGNYEAQGFIFGDDYGGGCSDLFGSGQPSSVQPQYRSFRVPFIIRADEENFFPTFETTLSLRNAGDVETSTFTSGESIKFVLTVRNLLDLPQKLKFPYGQTFDFAVFGPGQGSPLWFWSNGQGFTQAVTYVTWDPGETKEFSVVWDQHLYGFPDPGPLIESGNYEAQGFLYGYGGNLFLEAPPASPSQYRSARLLFVIQ
jgi:F0F1-type ATP synthase assembly protein I